MDGDPLRTWGLYTQESVLVAFFNPALNGFRFTDHRKTEMIVGAPADLTPYYYHVTSVWDISCN